MCEKQEVKLTLLENCIWEGKMQIFSGRVLILSYGCIQKDYPYIKKRL